MELAAHHIWVVSQFSDFHQLAIRRHSRKDHAGSLKLFTEGIIELKSMAVTLIHMGNSIGVSSFCSALDLAWIKPDPHRPAHLAYRALFDHQVDHRAFCASVKLRGIRILQVEHMSC